MQKLQQPLACNAANPCLSIDTLSHGSTYAGPDNTFRLHHSIVFVLRNHNFLSQIYPHQIKTQITVCRSFSKTLKLSSKSTLTNSIFFPSLTFSPPKHKLTKKNVFSNVPHRLRSFLQGWATLHPRLFNQSRQTTRHRSHRNRPHQTLSSTGTVRLHHPQNLRLRLEQPGAATLSPSPKRRRNRPAGSNRPSPQPCLHA